MKLKLTAEIAVMCMAVIIVGTWEGWLRWPEGALMTAALTLLTSVEVVRRLSKKPAA